MVKVGVECGQRLFSFWSWRNAKFRTFPKGFAVGPVMFWRTK